MIIADVVALFANPARAMQEKRKSQRQPISRYAKLQLPGGSLPRDCLVTDMSEGGVRLHVEGVDVPEQFAVLLSIGGGTAGWFGSSATKWEPSSLTFWRAANETIRPLWHGYGN